MESLDKVASLSGELEALKSSMDRVSQSTTPDHAKWTSFKTFAISFNDLSKSYGKITGAKSFPKFDTEKMKSPGDLVWPTHKQIFEMVYLEVSRLLAKVAAMKPVEPAVGFDELLHPKIREASAHHFKNSDFRNAVLDGILCLSDTIRELAQLDLDGQDLCNQAFSLKNAKIVLSELETQSGRNDQLGYLDMVKGLYTGVRNPSAHSRASSFDSQNTAQYLAFISLLMSRLDSATVVAKQ